MAFKPVNNVKQLSATSGTSAYQFASTPAGYADFASQLAPGDTTWYGVRDQSGSWEVGRGTFQTGPVRIERTSVIASSTGSAISWPGTGTREVVGGLPAEIVASIFSPTAGTGIIVGTNAAAATFVRRTLGAGTHISWTNGDGVSGAPTLNDSLLATNFLRRNAAASLVSALEMAAGFTLEVDYFAGSPSVAPWNGPAGEAMFRWRRAGAQDYTAELRQSSAWRRMLTANASDLNAADLLAGQDPTASALYSTSTTAGFIDFGAWFGGLAINFGKVTGLAANTSQDVTLGLAYSTAHLIAIAGQNVAGGSLSGNAQANPHASTPLTKITVRNDAGGSVDIYWLSIGY